MGSALSDSKTLLVKKIKEAKVGKQNDFENPLNYLPSGLQNQLAFEDTEWEKVDPVTDTGTGDSEID